MVVGFQKECDMSLICAVIPARCGSKSIKDKNIQLLGGKPLLVYSIETAIHSIFIGRIIVSTDSEEYAAIASKWGAEVVVRPKELSQDNSCDVDWVLHLLSQLKEKPKYLVHLRPTSPLRQSFIVNNAIRCINNHPEASALRSVTPQAQSAYKHFEIDGSYLKSVGSGSFNLDEANKPRHLYPTTYDANGYVDILKTAYVLKNNRIHGDKVIPFMVPRITDIDTQEDLDYARFEAR